MLRFLMPALALAWVRGLLAISPLFLFLVGTLGAVSIVGAALTPSGGHGLALLPDGQMAGWGANEFAQVQAGQSAFLQNPQRISLPGARARVVVAGSRHSLAVDETGSVWAWGDNSSGQLGLGHTKPVTGMARVQGLPAQAAFIAAGTQHSMALLRDGTVWVWGANNRGQLGRGAADAFAVQAKPARVSPLARVTDVASGNDFVLALVGPRDRSGATKGTVWAWGAGNGSPHVVDGFQGVSVVRAAGDLAMARTATGGYWQWRPEQTPPGIAQRAAFEKLGEMTHPLLAALTAPTPTPAAPSGESPPRAVAATAVAAASTRPTAITPSAAAPVLEAPTSTVPLPTARVVPLAVAAVPATAMPAAASTPVRPASALPAVTAPVAVSLTASVAATPAPMPVVAPATLSLSGTVRLSAAFGIDNTGKVLENVQVAADGAQCSATDSQGRYVCSVPAGWTGRVTLRRSNYRFSPSALSFQNLRVDAGQQDFAAIYDPR